MGWLVLPLAVVVLILLGLADTKHRWTQRWADRTEARRRPRGRHYDGTPAAEVVGRISSLERAAGAEALKRWLAAYRAETLRRLETTHEIRLGAWSVPVVPGR